MRLKRTDSEFGDEPSGFHKMRGISWLAEDRLASQEGLCFMQLQLVLNKSDIV